MREEPFNRFTNRAKDVMEAAIGEARRLNHGSVGAEHLLLGILHVGHSASARTLKSLGVQLDTAREQVGLLTGGGETPLQNEPVLAPSARRALEHAFEETRSLNHHILGPAPILLGILRDTNGVAVKVLEGLGVEADQVRVTLLAQVAPRNPPGAGLSALLMELRGVKLMDLLRAVQAQKLQAIGEGDYASALRHHEVEGHILEQLLLEPR